jgi:hypothetical protein
LGENVRPLPVSIVVNNHNYGRACLVWSSMLETSGWPVMEVGGGPRPAPSPFVGASAREPPAC